MHHVGLHARHTSLSLSTSMGGKSKILIDTILSLASAMSALMLLEALGHPQPVAALCDEAAMARCVAWLEDTKIRTWRKEERAALCDTAAAAWPAAFQQVRSAAQSGCAVLSLTSGCGSTWRTWAVRTRPRRSRTRSPGCSARRCRWSTGTRVRPACCAERAHSVRSRATMPRCEPPPLALAWLAAPRALTHAALLLRAPRSRLDGAR